MRLPLGSFVCTNTALVLLPLPPEPSSACTVCAPTNAVAPAAIARTRAIRRFIDPPSRVLGLSSVRTRCRKCKSRKRRSFEIVKDCRLVARFGRPRSRRDRNTVNTPRARVLVVDDDETVSEILSRYLVREGFVVDTVADGTAALAQAAAWQPDLIVLDLMLPDVSGLEICRRLRASESSSVPIIMLTARGEERERIFGLRLGADDYIVKPFSPREVAARVASVLRRTNGRVATGDEGPDTLSAGEIVVDLRHHSVQSAGVEVGLTPREFELLAFLMRRPNEVISRSELLERVWGYSVGDASTVTVHIRRLRAKLEAV